MNFNKPNIYNFKDPLSFLKAEYEFALSQRPEFSIRKWAQEIQLPPDYLLNVFKNKKKISLNVASILASHFKLDSTECKYLEMMVRLSLAKSLNERQNLELVLAELGQLKGTRAYVEDASVFSHWIHMAILSMSKLTHFHCSRESVSELLREAVSQDIIDNAIARLLRNDLITVGEQGRIQKRYDHTTTKNDAFKKAPHEYFEQVSELAKKGAQIPSNEREYQCFSMAISHEDIPAFKEMMRAFRAKVASFADGRPADQVYQFNLQFFPLTEKYERMGELNVNEDLERFNQE